MSAKGDPAKLAAHDDASPSIRQLGDQLGMSKSAVLRTPSSGYVR
jgi:hypothetical protein